MREEQNYNNEFYINELKWRWILHSKMECSDYDYSDRIENRYTGLLFRVVV